MDNVRPTRIVRIARMTRTISVIGSFKQHNREIQRTCEIFRNIGLHVNSPESAEIVEEGIDFVRFHTDPQACSDAAIQSLALHRILRSDLVYAVLPYGYIGRTTCYEVGRILQSKRPIYFSERPGDFPVHIPDAFIVDVARLSALLEQDDWCPEWLFSGVNNEEGILETRLINGDFVDD